MTPAAQSLALQKRPADDQDPRQALLEERKSALTSLGCRPCSSGMPRTPLGRFPITSVLGAAVRNAATGRSSTSHTISVLQQVVAGVHTGQGSASLRAVLALAEELAGAPAYTRCHLRPSRRSMTCAKACDKYSASLSEAARYVQRSHRGDARAALPPTCSSRAPQRLCCITRSRPTRRSRSDKAPSLISHVDGASKYDDHTEVVKGLDKAHAVVSAQLRVQLAATSANVGDLATAIIASEAPAGADAATHRASLVSTAASILSAAIPAGGFTQDQSSALAALGAEIGQGGDQVPRIVEDGVPVLWQSRGGGGHHTPSCYSELLMLMRQLLSCPRSTHCSSTSAL